LGQDDQADHLVRQGLPILTAVDHLGVAGGVVRPIIDPVQLYAWSVAWRSKASRDLVAAIEAAVEAVTADTEWLTIPVGAALAHAEASQLPTRRAQCCSA